MAPNGFMGGVYRLCEWVMRLAYLNILWTLFTLAGFIVLGLFPSTVAMFAVTRKWAMGERDISVFQVFWGTYKDEFLKANQMGIMVIASGAILLMDFKYIISQEGVFFQVLTFVILSAAFLYVIMMVYLFPVFVHYEGKYLERFKNALLIGLTRPIQTFVMVVGCVTLILVELYFPQLLFFFGGSAISLLLMASAYQAFTNIEKQKSKLENAEELTAS